MSRPVGFVIIHHRASLPVTFSTLRRSPLPPSLPTGVTPGRADTRHWPAGAARSPATDVLADGRGGRLRRRHHGRAPARLFHHALQHGHVGDVGVRRVVVVRAGDEEHRLVHVICESAGSQSQSSSCPGSVLAGDGTASTTSSESESPVPPDASSTNS